MNSETVKKLLEEDFQKAVERRKMFVLEMERKCILEGIHYFHFHKPDMRGKLENITE